MNTSKFPRGTARSLPLSALLFVATLLPLALAGCLVAGVSSTGGAFIWPGGIGLLVVLLIVFFLLRRR